MRRSDIMRGAAAGSIAWVVSRLVAQGLEFAAWVLLARRLGASAVGILAVAAIAARFLGLVGDWGAAIRGPRDVVVAGRDSALVGALVRRRQLVSMVLAGAMAATMIVSGHIELTPIAATVLARGAGRDWIALGEGRRRDAAMPLLVQGTIILAAVSMTSTVAAAALALGIGNLAGLAVGVMLNPVRWTPLAARMTVDGWYLLAGIADQVLTSAGTALLLWLRSADEAGIYVSISRLPLAWITIVGLLTTAAIPVVAGAIAKGDLKADRLHRQADLVALAGALIVIPVAVVGMLLLGPVFGDDFVAGREPLLLLFVAAAATTASTPYRVLYTTLGSDRFVGLVTAGAALGSLVANLAMIGTWGMQGAALTTVLSQLGMLAFLAGWSRRHRRLSADGERVGELGTVSVRGAG